MQRKMEVAADEALRVRKASLKATELDSDQRTVIREIDAKLRALQLPIGPGKLAMPGV